MADAEKPQLDKFRDLARELGADEDEAHFANTVRQIAPKPEASKVCPECGHTFQGNGWDGIDAHWRSKHETLMPYEDAWPLLQRGDYPQRG